MYGVKEGMMANWFGVLAAQRVGRIANRVPNGKVPTFAGKTAKTELDAEKSR